MSQPQLQQPFFTTRGKQPLIAIPVEEDGEMVIYYFNSDKEADAFSKKRQSIQKALDAAGSWKELDSEDGPDPLDELDRIRHESKPTPLFKL
jgi:3-methyladenine DNA glycosylase/8-oxoguanine DNA glycosylase